jgi:hypothetical protein
MNADKFTRFIEPVKWTKERNSFTDSVAGHGSPSPLWVHLLTPSGPATEKDKQEGRET